MDPSLEIRYNINSGSTLNVNAGSVTSAFGIAEKLSTIQNKLNGRLFNVNGGNGGASAYVDTTLDSKCNKAIRDLQGLSAYLAQQTPNNNAAVPKDQPGPLNFVVSKVNADGSAVFSLTCDEALNNPKVQQIEIRNDANAKIVIINLAGRTCTFEQANMVGNWLNSLTGRARTLWNIYERPLNSNTKMYIRRNFMGALLAPYYPVETSANIDGAAAVYSMTARSEMHKPGLEFPACMEVQSE